MQVTEKKTVLAAADTTKGVPDGTLMDLCVTYHHLPVYFNLNAEFNNSGLRKVVMRMFLAAIVSLCVFGTARAAEHVMTKGDAGGESSFNSGIGWDDGQPPVAGNTYRLGGFLMRTPEGTDNYVFQGDRLTIDSNSYVAWKSSGPLTVADLVFEGEIGHAIGNLPNGARLFGAITIPAGALARFYCANSETGTRVFNINSTISGSGNLQVTMGNSNFLNQVSLLADNSDFTGRIILCGFHKFNICQEEALGAVPSLFNAAQLEFNGATLLVTNSLALDDPTRGITLNNTLSTGYKIQRCPGGGFEVTGTNTATVACVIAGAGPLTKRGSGTLLLATNNTYTGLTTIEGGTLRLATNVLPTANSVVVTGATAMLSGEGALSNVTLDAGGSLVAEKNGWSIGNLSLLGTVNAKFALDLSEADPATALIRVSDPLIKPPMHVFQFTVNTNNTTAVPYKVLSAPNLADYAEYDFCVTPPWIGELSLADDGANNKVLLFTPTLPEEIVFKMGSDPGNDTGFTNALWSSLAPPTADKSYVLQEGLFRTPQYDNLTFPGKRLVIDGTALALKGAGVPTITNLIMMNEALFGMSQAGGSRMAGTILLHPVLNPGLTYSMGIQHYNCMGRHLDIYSTLAGYGELFLQVLGDPSYENNPLYANTIYQLHAESPGFFGKIRIDGNSNFWVRVTGEERLGANPPLFRVDQLSFNGGGLSVTNNVTLDDSNRGITLLATGGLVGTTSQPGGFPYGTPAALLRYEGGCTFRPEFEHVTLTVACQITGAGTLIKNGAGTLVLCGANTYAGQTEVVAGTLYPATVEAIGSGAVLLKAEGRLLRRYPDTGMPNGIELGGAITFEPGSAVRVELAEGQTLSGNFTLPLFLLAEGETIDPASVPVEHGFTNYKTVVTTSMVGSRELVTARFVFQGTVIMVR